MCKNVLRQRVKQDSCESSNFMLTGRAVRFEKIIILHIAIFKCISGDLSHTVRIEYQVCYILSSSANNKEFKCLTLEIRLLKIRKNRGARFDLCETSEQTGKLF